MCSIAWMVSKHQISCWYEEFMKRNAIAVSISKISLSSCSMCVLQNMNFYYAFGSSIFWTLLHHSITRRMPFVCFTPFKFDLGKRITTDTHQESERDRVVYVLIQVLFCITLNTYPTTMTTTTTATTSQFLSSFLSSGCTHASTMEGFELSWDESSFPAITMQNVCTETFVNI